MTRTKDATDRAVGRAVDLARRRAPAELLGAVRRLREWRFVGLAAEIAFFVGAGLAPFAVSVLALAGVLSPVTGDAVQRFEASVGAFLVLRLEHETELLALDGLRSILDGNLSLVLVPLVVATVLAARGFTGATRGVAHLYGREESDPVWRDALVTLGFTVTAELIGAVAGAIALMLPAGRGGAAAAVIGWGRWIVIPAAIAALVSALYRHAQGGGASWRGQVIGALVATGGMVGVAVSYAIYLRVSPSLGMGPVLGPVVGGVVATFSFVFGLAVAVLLGGAINAEHAARER